MLKKGECATSLVLEFVSCVVKNLPEVPDDVMDGWVKNPKALQKALHVLCPPETASERPGLLRRIATTTATGVQRFVCDDEALKAANIGWTGKNFKAHFLDKVEEGVSDAVVVVHRLERASPDVPILAELGNRAEIQLAHFFALLQKQSKGEDGLLLVNGYANVAYIKGNDGSFWAVRAFWSSGYRDWFVEAYSVEAYSVEDPSRWDDGRQVLSRDS